MIRMEIYRFRENTVQTLGLGVLFDHSMPKYHFKTLELPWRFNEQNKSRIPSGRYKCRLRYSNAHGYHFEIRDVWGRTYILIHAGNFFSDITGCIVVGKEFKDINNDGYTDVTESKRTLEALTTYSNIPEFDLYIWNCTEKA